MHIHGAIQQVNSHFFNHCLSFYEKFNLESVEWDFLLINRLTLVGLLQIGGEQGSPALEMGILNQGSQD